jgi:DNA helicase II / ATP-dependent DNA helicase PcrA
MESRPDVIVGIERTLFNTLLNVTGRPYFDLFSYRGRTTVFRLLFCAETLRDACPGAVAWLEAAAIAFAEVLTKEEYLSPAETHIFAASVEEMKTDMRKLSTLHNAKGREYAAVAMIDLHEGRIPSYYARTGPEIEEQKRLFYVGVTRAERYLLYVTDNSDWRNTPSRFLKAGTGVGLC